MTKNGCFNREPLRETAWVQSGWSEIGNDFGSPSRMPVMVKIKVQTTLACQYQKSNKDDKKCIGCTWMEGI
jgi:hypothetical protein